MGGPSNELPKQGGDNMPLVEGKDRAIISVSFVVVVYFKELGLKLPLYEVMHENK
jgi:hypothetical protein